MHFVRRLLCVLTVLTALANCSFEKKEKPAPAPTPPEVPAPPAPETQSGY